VLLRLALVVAGLSGLALAASPAGHAHVANVASTVPQGGVVFAVARGYAPPNEFCQVVSLWIDRVKVPPVSRRADDAGTWVLEFKATQTRGWHSLELRQACESGKDGTIRISRAFTSFRVT